MLHNNSTLTQSCETANSFLKLLGETPYLFQTFDDNSKRKDKSLTRQFYGSLDEHWDELLALNNKGAGIFVTVNVTDGNNRKAENITAVRALFIDCDNGLPDEFHLTPTMVIHSSKPDKGHAYWVLNEPSNDVDKFPQKQQQLIKHYGSDKSVHDRSRVMRLPGFLHIKGEPTLVTFQHIGKHYESMGEVTSALPKQPAKTTSSTHKPITHITPPTPATSPEFQALLASLLTAGEGERNNTLNRVAFEAGKLVQSGKITADVARQQLTSVALMIGLGEAEIDATLTSGLTAGINKQTNVNTNNKSKVNIVVDVVNAEKSHLSWDVYKGIPLYDGKHIDLRELRLDLCVKYEVDLNRDDFKDAVEVVAKRNSYNPVETYLTSLDTTTPTTGYIQQLSEMLGLETDIERVYLRKFLMASVARGLKHGCKFDNVVIFQGKQGVGKTTFFEVLFGEELFATAPNDGNERDILAVCHSHWCIEFGEWERFNTKREQSEIKNFITKQRDDMRLLHTDYNTERKRKFVIVGTTNKDQFLVDETGSRRYWVCRIRTPRIDMTWLAKHRDAIWGEAYNAYLADEPWWLDELNETLQHRHNQQFNESSSLDEAIVEWLAGRYTADGGVSFKPSMNGKLSTRYILTNVIGSKLSDGGLATKERDVKKALARLGFVSKQRRCNGVKGYYWEHPDISQLVAVSDETEALF
ncbi:VapE domain-containing protein [Nostoc sp. CENA543]|uniref:VapE domain-containing protein n=1 Tax=Nostoc sp. CENA543 TaxID=1869241 RepID=UPI0018642016|nr:VapE domain-containing protein [Nostoc sp. CENA543]